MSPFDGPKERSLDRGSIGISRGKFGDKGLEIVTFLELKAILGMFEDT